MPYKTKRRPSVSRRLKIVVAICAVVAAVLSLSGLYLKQQETLDRANAEAASFTPAPLETPASDAAPAVSAAILGDSFTEAADGYAAQLANLMGWDAEIMGQGGTGYVNPGHAEENESAFPDRVPAIVELAPQVVVVQGSTNDGDGSGLREAADSVYSQLKAGLPESQIVAVGPVGAPAIPREKVDTARSTLAEAAAAHGIPFIDPVEEGWLADPALFADGVHPTPEGHKQLASLIAEAIKGI